MTNVQRDSFDTSDNLVEIENKNDDLHRDAATSLTGAHPVGMTAGAAGGALTGAALGSIGGPIGMGAGAMMGALAGSLGGGLLGSSIAEMINPTEEEHYWRSNFAGRPYASGATYESYQPAYRYGYDALAAHQGRSFDEAENDLRTDWESDATRNSGLGWDKARHAVRDSYERGTSLTQQRLAAKNLES